MKIWVQFIKSIRFCSSTRQSSGHRYAKMFDSNEPIIQFCLSHYMLLLFPWIPFKNCFVNFSEFKIFTYLPNHIEQTHTIEPTFFIFFILYYVQNTYSGSGIWKLKDSGPPFRACFSISKHAQKIVKYIIKLVVKQKQS